MISRATLGKLLITLAIGLLCGTRCGPVHGPFWSGRRRCPEPRLRSAQSRPRLPRHSTGVIFVSMNGARTGPGLHIWGREMTIRSRPHCPESPIRTSYTSRPGASRASRQETCFVPRTRPRPGRHSRAAWQVHPCDGHVGVRFQYSRDGRARWRIPQQGRRRQLGAHLASQSRRHQNIESIAIDPKTRTWSMRTWHLAWKTADGGSNWQHINKGMIDDSDVFSIIVDHSNLRTSSPAPAPASTKASRRAISSKDSRHSILGAAYARAAPGSDQSEHCLCRNDRGALEDDGPGQDLEARQQS